MTDLAPVEPALLRRPCDFGALKFDTTADLPDYDGVLGQPRAMEAMRFGLGVPRNGYNLFVLGPPGTGRHAIALRSLKAQAANEPAHHDWAYVFNFVVPHRPAALSFPPGRGPDFRRDMERFVHSLRAALPALFESDEYRTRRKLIEEEFQDRQAQAFKELQEEAKKKSLALVRTPMGFALAPTANGEVMQPDVFHRMPEPVRKQFEADIEEMQGKLQAVVQAAPDWESERRDKVRALNHEMAQAAVSRLIAPLQGTWRELPDIAAHLAAVQRDLIENADDFLPQEPQSPMEAAAQVMGRGRKPEAIFKRYAVNVIVSTDPSDGAPVVAEDLPTQPNLVGRVEHLQEMGALVTDFTLIKAGALHRANGGYLMLDALKLLQQPFAWEALKRALRNQIVTVESVAQMASLVSTVSLEPAPIPLTIKVALVGDRELYYLLSRLHPEFNDLFKVAVDIDDQMDAGRDAAAA